MLDRLRAEGMGVLHDRRIPASRANIDHLVVSPAGVFIVDAKNYSGRVERVDRGGLFSSDYRLYVGRRDQTKLIGGMARQVEAVRSVIGAGVRITQAICFVSADWSLFARPLRFGDVHVLWPRELAKLIRVEGSLGREQIDELERKLAAALPAA
jgi:Nuclease-related domain